MAAGVFVPVALRRRAPVMAFGGLLVLAVLFGDMAPGHVPGAAIAAVSLVFLAPPTSLYTVTVTSSRRTGGAALAPGAGAAGVHRRLPAATAATGAPAELVPVGAGQRHRLDDGLLGAAAPAVRGAVAAAGGEQRGRRRAAADRPGAARRGGAQHVGDRRAGRLRPVRHRRQPRRRARGARRDPGHQPGSPRRDAPDARRAAPAGRHPGPGQSTPGARRRGRARTRDRSAGWPASCAGLGPPTPSTLPATAAADDATAVATGRRRPSGRDSAAAARRRSRPPRAWPTSTGSSSAPAARGPGEPRGLRAGPPAAGRPRPVGLPDRPGGAHQRGQARGERRPLHGPPRLRRGRARHQGDR